MPLIDKNECHQKPLHASKSLLDTPYSITDFCKNCLARPTVAEYRKVRDFPNLAYRRTYEYWIDQFVGKRYMDREFLDCDIIQVVLDQYKDTTDTVLVTFVPRLKFTLPTTSYDYLSDENYITKYWGGAAHNHRTFLATGPDYRPLDSRAEPDTFYTKCKIPDCFTCDPASSQQGTEQAISSTGPSTGNPIPESGASNTYGATGTTSTYSGTATTSSQPNPSYNYPSYNYPSYNYPSYNYPSYNDPLQWASPYYGSAYNQYYSHTPTYYDVNLFQQPQPNPPQQSPPPPPRTPTPPSRNVITTLPPTPLLVDVRHFIARVN